MNEEDDDIPTGLQSKKVLNTLWTKDNQEKLKEFVREQCMIKHFNKEYKFFKQKMAEKQVNEEQGVVIISDRGNIEFANHNFLMISKQNEDEVQGENINIFIDKKFRHDHGVILQDFFENDLSYATAENLIIRTSKLITKQDRVVNIIYSSYFCRTILDGVVFKYCVIQVRADEVLWDAQQMIVHPNNNQVFLWSMMMLALIFIVSVTTPYTLVFQLEGEQALFENVSDLMFIADIVVNFNLGYIEGKSVIMDRGLVAYKYLRGDFLLDFISSFPFNQLNRFTNFEGGGLKVLKLLKFVRFFRLVKVSKVFKGMAIITKQIKSPEGKWLDQLIFYFFGTFKLIEMIVQLFLMSHQYACIFMTFQEYPTLMESSFINMTQFNGQQLSWWMENEPVQAQRQILNELVATALNQSRVDYFNDKEQQVDMVWAIVGVAFFSLTIGNASQYILLDNEENIKFKALMEVLDETQIEYTLSDELCKEIRASVIKNKHKIIKANVEDIKPIIDDQVYQQFLAEMYEPFIKRHTFFEKISLDLFPILEREIKYQEITDKLFYVNKVADEIYMIIDGKIKMQDRTYQTVAEQEKDSVIGIEEFRALFEFNQAKENDLAWNADKGQTSQNDDENFIVYRQYTAKSIGDTVMLAVSYSSLLTLCTTQPEFQDALIEQSQSQQQGLSYKEIIDTQKKTYKFDNDITEPSLLVLGNGMIFRKNKAFLESFKDHDITGQHLFDFLLKDGIFPPSSFAFNNEQLNQVQDWKSWEVLIKLTEDIMVIKKKVENEIINPDTTVKTIKSRILQNIAPSVKYDGLKMNVYIITFSKVAQPTFSFSDLMQYENIMRIRKREHDLRSFHLIDGNGDNDLAFMLNPISNKTFELPEKKSQNKNNNSAESSVEGSNDGDKSVEFNWAHEIPHLSNRRKFISMQDHQERIQSKIIVKQRNKIIVPKNVDSICSFTNEINQSEIKNDSLTEKSDNNNNNHEVNNENHNDNNDNFENGNTSLHQSPLGNDYDKINDDNDVFN